MFKTLLKTLTEKDKSETVEVLVKDSTPNDDFFFLTILSVLMATFGLLIDSASVVIGSMLIAPLLSPILSLAMGIVMADGKLLSRSLATIVKALLFTIPAAALVAYFFSPLAQVSGQNMEIASRLHPDIISIAIAIVAGAAASFAMTKPKLSATLPGVAISVAIIPPLGVTGIGLARLDFQMATNAFLLFLLNAVGIVAASMVVFSMARMHTKRPVAARAVEREDRQMEKDEAKAEHAK